MSLIELPIKEFVEKLGADTPTPGGGSVAALSGSLCAGLCVMVARLTLGREKYREVWETMAQVRDSADEMCRQLLELVDRDTEAYNKVMTAFRMPKEDEKQKAARKAAIQEASKEAARTPLETLKKVAGMMDLIEAALEKGNPNCITDVGVAAQLALSAAMGAAYNVRINLSGIKDKSFCALLKKEVDGLTARVKDSIEIITSKIEQRLGLNAES